ncbi:MAG: ATP synthase F1 subunit epsilon [Ignavibacteriaceae bacterium]|nr:ATP synthase F1 subunit epsilon [Ignavibacteriaceae bacterium]
MSVINLEIITPSKKAFNGEVKSITVPGTKGSFQVLYNHAPLMSTFEFGEIKITLPDEKVIHLATGGGTVEVNNNKVLILADSVELVGDIDLERAKLAEQRAAERLKNRDNGIDITRAELSLARATNRLKLADKYSR